MKGMYGQTNPKYASACCADITHIHLLMMSQTGAQDQDLMETDLKEAAVTALDSSKIFQVITMSSVTWICSSLE